LAQRARSSSGPSGKALVIVESPAKARTIGRFLGEDYTVQASIGHVRDLPQSSADVPADVKGTPAARFGVDLENNFEPVYVVPASKKEQIRTLKRLLKTAPAVWLATDEDREGEAISWHLREVLKPKVPVHRLVFHEITKEAIARALENPREIDEALVQAQETRRILDRLYGYELSPVLWRKIRTGLSAGRVQSVALRLLVEREQDRIAFHSASYWDIKAVFAAGELKSDAFEAALIEVGGKRVASGRDFEATTGKLKARDVCHLDEGAARALASAIDGETANVLSVEEKPYTQRPAPPFTTSTLQQEAGRKLRLSARRTMRAAQTLYENGVITYMRTDSTALSTEAIEGARSFIRENYGPDYLPPKPRHYKAKVKNAQEAHEAIRPAGAAFQPIERVRREHGQEAANLYSLIWMRTVASQMPDARGRRIAVRVGVKDAVFRAAGKTIEFAGFQRAYVEGSDDPDGELLEGESLLPPVKASQALATREVVPEGHTTQPPARFTDASLVKELDARGIGRPSTWAAIIGVLLDRTYAFRKGSQLVPTFTGFAVVRMLRAHFGALLDYDFTARMEDDLDSVSRGEGDGKAYLRRFYIGNGDTGLRDLVQTGMEQVDPREACGIDLGELDGRKIEVRVGRYGLFVTDGEANASLPEQTVPDELTLAEAIRQLDEAAQGPRSLGEDPATGKPVYVKSGPYGPYVQLGDPEEGSKKKPKMVSLLRGMDAETIELAMALKLLSLPRELGPHPEDEKQEPVLALTGRYGPFVKWGSESRSIPEGVSVLEITLAEAVELLKQPRRRGRSGPTALKELGEHPETKAKITIMTGRYGPYVTDGEVNATIPRTQQPEDVTVDQAVELLKRRAERVAAQGGVKRKRKASGKKPTAKKKKKKPAAKKKAGAKKKPTARKKAAAKKKAAVKKDEPA
jgi:DNA topoisomerase-1